MVFTPVPARKTSINGAFAEPVPDGDELNELFPHGEVGNIHPGPSFGLVSVGFVNCADEKLLFHGPQELVVNVQNLPA